MKSLIDIVEDDSGCFYYDDGPDFEVVNEIGNSVYVLAYVDAVGDLSFREYEENIEAAHPQYIVTTREVDESDPAVEGAEPSYEGDYFFVAFDFERR